MLQHKASQRRKHAGLGQRDQGRRLQLVRKISSYRMPSEANEEVFDIAMDEIAGVSTKLLANLEYRVRATR